MSARIAILRIVRFYLANKFSIADVTLICLAVLWCASHINSLSFISISIFSVFTHVALLAWKAFSLCVLWIIDEVIGPDPKNPTPGSKQ